MTIDLNKMLQPGGIVPIDIPTTAALVAEVQRLREEVEVDNRNLGQLTDELAQCRREIERKDALLRKCLKHVASNISMTSDGIETEDLYDAIKQELQ